MVYFKARLKSLFWADTVAFRISLLITDADTCVFALLKPQRKTLQCIFSFSIIAQVEIIKEQVVIVISYEQAASHRHSSWSYFAFSQKRLVELVM